MSSRDKRFSLPLTDVMMWVTSERGAKQPVPSIISQRMSTAGITGRCFHFGLATAVLLLQAALALAAEPLAKLPLVSVGPDSMRYIRVDNALEIRFEPIPRPAPPPGSIVILKHQTLTRVMARGSVLVNDGSSLVLRLVFSSEVQDPDQLKEALRANYAALIYANIEDQFFEAVLKGQDVAPLILDGMRQNEALELKNAPFWGAAADRLRRDLDELRRLTPEQKSEVAGWIRYDQLCSVIEQRIPAKHRDGVPFFARLKVRDYLRLRNELRQLANLNPLATSVAGLSDLAEELQTLNPSVASVPRLGALAEKLSAAGLAADAEVLRGVLRRRLVAIVEEFLNQDTLWPDMDRRRGTEEALKSIEALSAGGSDRQTPTVEELIKRLAQVDLVMRLRELLASKRPEEVLQGIKGYSTLPASLQAVIASDLLLGAKAKTELAERAERALVSSNLAALQALLREVDEKRLELTFRKQLEGRLAELRRAAKAKVVAKRTAPPAKTSNGTVQPTTPLQDSVSAPAQVPRPPQDNQEAPIAARGRLLDEFRSLTTRVRGGLSIGNSPIANYGERLNQFAKDLAAFAPRLEVLREESPTYSTELRSLAEIVGTAINSFTEVKRMCDGLEAQLQSLGAGQGFRPEYVRQVEQESAALRTRLGPFFTLNPPLRESLDDLVRRVKEREVARKAPAPKRIL